VARTAEKYYSFPIASITKSAADDDDLIVRGRATDGTLDHDMQVVDPAFSGPALKTWLSTGGNVRMSHDPRRPIGKGISAETDHAGATWVTSAIVEPLAQKLLRKGVLTSYSVGIANPRIRSDPSGRATGGIICGGSIVELTLCDRGSNPACGVTLLKSVGGVPLYSGTVYRVTKSGKVKVTKARKRAPAGLQDDPDDIMAWLLNNGDPATQQHARELVRSRGLHF